MSFTWLKRYMPRGLFGRAALILVLPVVTLQLVVSVLFIQRHFEGVTEQLSREAARSVNFAMAAGPDAPGVARALDFVLEPVAPGQLAASDSRRWYDFTGIVVTRTLHGRVEGLQAVEIPDGAQVLLSLRDGETAYRVRLERGRVSASNPHQLLVNMAFFGALMTLIAFLYLRNQLRPITRLADAATAFGRGRIVPYSPSGAVEVRAAGHAFLDMRARIERQIEQRTLMLSGVSHDLRTPLTRLRLGLSLLEDVDREPLERDVDEMRRMIDAFLDFARGTAESATPEPVEPAALARSIVEDARRAGQPVEMGLCTGEGEVMLRAAAMRRAMENLVNNAVRHGTRCVVGVTLTAKSLRISVEDDGPGIPPQDRESALKPFVRLDPARNQDKNAGVGLGLAIAADVARLHGGVLRLGESAALGGLKADIVIAR